jgi:DNA-binding NtrC family response regulator
VEIPLPPLRARMGDLPLLAEHFIARAADAAGRVAPVLDPEALDLLLGHRWPGNVRALPNCVARAVVMATGDVIRPENIELIDRGATGPAQDMSLAEAERAHVVQVLQATDGHKSRAAAILQISRPRLDRIIEKYGIELGSASSGELGGSRS